MTVDRELRKMWKKDFQAFQRRLDNFALMLARLDTEIAIHHPRIAIRQAVDPATGAVRLPVLPPSPGDPEPELPRRSPAPSPDASADFL